MAKATPENCIYIYYFVTVPDMCWITEINSTSSASFLINSQRVLTIGRESEAEKEKDNKDTGMAVIRQRHPSALSCVYSVSAHDIHAGETNL